MKDIIENFDVLPLSFNFTGDWERSTTPAPKSGTYCFGSKKGLAVSGKSAAELSITVDSEKQLSFYHWVSCDLYQGFLRFYVDNVEVFSKYQMSTKWAEFTCFLPTGNHVLKWQYENNSSNGGGDKRAYIDNLSIREPLPTLNIERFATVTATDYFYVDGNITDSDTTSGAAEFYQNTDSGIILTFPEVKRIIGVTTTWNCGGSQSAGIGEYSICNSSNVLLSTIKNKLIYQGTDTEIISSFPVVETNQIKITQTLANDYVMLVRVQVFKEADAPVGILPFTINVDTKRITTVPQIINFDTCRQLKQNLLPFVVKVDTIRKMATSLTNCKAINLKIAAKTLADTFSIQTFNPVEIGQLFTGNIKTIAYHFKAEETSQMDKLTTVVGKYDIDDILNKGVHNLFNNTSITTTTITAINTMQTLAKVLGKTLNINITDFYPADFPITPTGKELISALFGWTDKIPQKQINVFIRGNVIHVLERGKESGIVEVTKYANVSSNRKKIRTLQDPLDVAGIEIKGAVVGQPPQQDAPDETHYISGVFTNGDSSITYSNGLVTKESHTVKGVEEITVYSYSRSMPPAYLTLKKTMTTTTSGNPPVTTHGSISVSYSYNNEKLILEVEEHYTDDKLEMKRITRHYPLGQGMWGTSIEEDGETTYGSINQGAPGGKASAYSIAQDSENHNNPKSTREPPIYMIPGNPYSKYLGSWPVTDQASIIRIANEIIWLDKKTEVKITLDAYGDTIFDLSKKILWQGNEYFLESNTVSVDSEKTLQRLEMIRWE